MNYLKKYGLRLFYTFLFLFLALFFITLLYYFNVINETFYKVLKLIILIGDIFINSFILGKNAQAKGYLEGIKLSLLIIVIFFLLSLFFKEPLKLSILIYYLIITTTSTLGSMIGIQKKKN